MPDSSAPATKDLPGRFDADRFRRLIEIAGPSLAPALLDQLDEDLRACLRKFETACDQADVANLRQASHDLIALAGSCGAEVLHDTARLLNDYAHRRALPQITALRPVILAETQSLLATIRHAARTERA